MEGFIFNIIILLGVHLVKAQTDKEPWIEIYPQHQRVAEGSRALFTCVSNIENGEFRWGKPTRSVSEKKDGVIITQLSHNTSTLEILKAHVKRHKRTFRCSVSSPTDGMFMQFDSTLKVLPWKKINSNFPKITGIRQEEKFKFTSGAETTPTRVSTEIQCVTSAAKKPFTWRWIRGQNEELKLSSDFKSGKLQINDDYLAINNPKEADYDTTYTCVAHNEYGTVYSQQIKINMTQAPGESSFPPCKDRYGLDIKHGEMYIPGEDPCTQCECTFGQPGRCAQAQCRQPRDCKRVEWSTEECCAFVCLDVGANSTQLRSGQCVAFDGSAVQNGEAYQPEEDPCLTCTCQDGLPVLCLSPGCKPPPCDNPQPVPGKCCQFVCPDEPPKPLKKGNCVAFDNSVVENGEVYQPEDDPCLKCTCQNGYPELCLSPGCVPPSCDNPQPVPGVCCEFLCLDEPPKPQRKEPCIAYDASVVQDGDIYQPEEDPCVQCTCKNGYPELCFSPGCIPPQCENPMPVPGKCCEFVCQDEQPNQIKSRQCIAYDKSVVQHGEYYQPRADPCYHCKCENGTGDPCLYTDCARPPCENASPVPGKCCEFVCPDDPPKPEPIVVAELYVQQVGARGAMVHWSVPAGFDKKEDQIEKFTVSISKDEGRGSTIQVVSRMYALVNDLDPNTIYTIRVKGTSMKSQILSTKPLQFMLRPRGSNGLVVSDAVGQVYESRGAIQYDGYSLPRQFTPINKLVQSHHELPDVVLNLNSFHRADISVYKSAPCPISATGCGLIRLYTFTSDGGMENPVSLLFEDEKDLQWAVSHL